MKSYDLNANAADQSAEEKTAIATKVGSSAESPANDNNYSFKINRKERALALKSALSLKANEYFSY